MSFIDRFIASSDPDIRCRKTKPNGKNPEQCEEIFKKALAIAGSKPEETVFVDDLVEHVQTFQGMGGHAIHCTGNWTRVEAELYNLGVRWE